MVFAAVLRVAGDAFAEGVFPVAVFDVDFVEVGVEVGVDEGTEVFSEDEEEDAAGAGSAVCAGVG